MGRLVALLVALAMATTACSSTGDQADDPAGLYQTNCASCHGENGAGGVGGSLIDEEYDASFLIDVVRNGIGTMPAFGRSLSQEEVDALVDYVGIGFKPEPG